MGDVFEAYDREVVALLASAAQARTSGDVVGAKRALVEASEVVEAMALEAATAPAAYRTELRVRIGARHADVARAERELAPDREADREALLGTSTGSGLSRDEDAALANTGRHIDESRRNIAATEAVGAGILQNLHQQRNTLLRAKETVVDIDGGIGTSRSIVASMNRRAQVNRIALYSVFGVIALSVGAVLWYRLTSGKVK